MTGKHLSIKIIMVNLHSGQNLQNTQSMTIKKHSRKLSFLRNKFTKFTMVMIMKMRKLMINLKLIVNKIVKIMLTKIKIKNLPVITTYILKVGISIDIQSSKMIKI